MLVTLATLTGLALAQQTDTTIAVQPGARLSVNNFGGEIVVRAGPENRVRVRGQHSSRTVVSVTAGPTLVSLKTEGRRGPPQLTDLDITVPRWMAVNLSGHYTHMSIEGVEGTVSAETVEGDVELVGGTGAVTLRSVEGSVTVRGARGRVDVGSVEGEIRVSETTGDVVAETVDGDIVLERLQSASVDANTVDGDIYYNGTIQNNGRYRLSTHDGDLTVGLPEGSNVTVVVSTFEGDFEASFPVAVTEARRGRRFQFTLGTGSARLELETFDGDIMLRRPAEMRTPEPEGGHDPHRKQKHENHDDN